MTSFHCRHNTYHINDQAADNVLRLSSHWLHWWVSDKDTLFNIFYVLRNKKLPGNLNGNPAISGSGAKRCGPNANGWKLGWRILERGSRGPSTVTLIAFMYVVTWAGTVDMHMVKEKLFPTNKEMGKKWAYEYFMCDMWAMPIFCTNECVFEITNFRTINFFWYYLA